MVRALIEISDSRALLADADVFHCALPKGDRKLIGFSIEETKPGFGPLNSGKHDALATSNPGKISQAAVISFQQVMGSRLILYGNQRNSVRNLAHRFALVHGNSNGRAIG